MNRGRVRGCAVVAALGSAWFSAVAAGDILAGWHFNGLAAPVAASVAAEHGSGSLDLSAFGGSGLSWQAGSDLNAWPGDAAGESLGITGTGANGKSAIFTVATAGYSGLSLSLAARATSTGHLGTVIEALDGGSWVAVGGFTLVPSTWSVATFDLGALTFLDGGEAVLRLRMEGASSSQGSFRIDNVRFEGAVVPASGTMALAGAAGLLGRRRRN